MEIVSGCRPSGTRFVFNFDPRLKPRAIFFRAAGAGRTNSIEIGSPRQVFIAKLCAQCEFSPSITEANASASR
jgi:hypothetical protein